MPTRASKHRIFKNMPTFEMKDLNGKVLKIYTAQYDRGGKTVTITAGTDTSTGEVFVISEEFNRVKELEELAMSALKILKNLEYISPTEQTETYDKLRVLSEERKGRKE